MSSEHVSEWTLVTGAKGFIGTHVTAELVSRGTRVIGLGHGAMTAPECERRGLEAWVNADVTFASLQSIAGDHGPPSAIVHLAGGASVGWSLQNPLEDYRRTVESSVELLEWARQSRAAQASDGSSDPTTGIRVVYASSAAVYGDGHSGPIAETTPLSPYSPYGTHKAVVEALCRSYCDNFGMQVAVVRLFSVYGAGLEKQLLYDLCVKLHRDTRVVRLGGTGAEVRDWFHVEDAARLMVDMCDNASAGCPVVNGGTGVATSVSEIAQHVADCWGDATTIEFSGERRPGNPFSLVADTGTAARSGFVPEIAWREGVRQTVERTRTTLQRGGARTPRP